jgi:hypothetical protein
VKPVKELCENGSSERGQGERAAQVNEGVKGETGPGGLWSRAWLGVWRRKWLDVWSHEGLGMWSHEWLGVYSHEWRVDEPKAIALDLRCGPRPKRVRKGREPQRWLWTSRRRLPWTCGVDRGQRAYEGAGSQRCGYGRAEGDRLGPEGRSRWRTKGPGAGAPEMAMDEPKATALDLRGDQGGVRRGREREPQRWLWTSRRRPPWT